MEKIDGIATSPSFWDFKGEGEYTDKKFLMSTPFPVSVTLILYLWFVLKFGPEFMKNRKPFLLKNTIVAYNVVQVLISCFIFQLGFRILNRHGMWSSTCFIEYSDMQNKILDGGHYYFLSKVVELLDTVFFVLRKKQRQVTFLHVYHHSMMVICTWSIVKYLKNDSTVFFATINALVHIVMYGYYALSVFPSLTKYLWWKKYITIMQLIQFVMMFAHMIISHAISECKPTYYLLTAVCFNTVLFLYLFGDFYVKSYRKSIRENASQISEAVCKNNVKLNDFINQHKMAGKMH